MRAAVGTVESLMTGRQREAINEQNVRYVIQLVREGSEAQIHQLASDVL